MSSSLVGKIVSKGMQQKTRLKIGKIQATRGIFHGILYIWNT